MRPRNRVAVSVLDVQIGSSTFMTCDNPMSARALQPAVDLFVPAVAGADLRVGPDPTVAEGGADVVVEQPCAPWRVVVAVADEDFRWFAVLHVLPPDSPVERPAGSAL